MFPHHKTEKKFQKLTLFKGWVSNDFYGNGNDQNSLSALAL